MLIEDVCRYLFPVDGCINHSPVFKLSSDNDSISELIQFGFDDHLYHREYDNSEHSLSSCLSKFGNQTAYRLLLSGREMFEVARNLDDLDRVVAFSVLNLDYLRVFLGFTWQTIPKNTLAEVAHRESSQPFKRRRVRIPHDRIVRIRLPREYRRIPIGLQSLRRVENSVYSYDSEELWGAEQRAVASVTQSVGWNCRWLHDDMITQYYMMHRFLQFEEFKAKLRQAVVDGINQILEIAGAHVKFKAKLSVHHLPTLTEIAVSREDLIDGQIEFNQMMDQYSIYRRGRSTSHE
ncbi:MAG: hypothetical protein OXF08_10685 [Bacteroidetes bacterium]|nr:hypothetical protein [Bacteroidota bacterium]